MDEVLQPGTDQRPYSVFEVVEPINVKSGSIASWFDEPGGGIQYLLPDTVDENYDGDITPINNAPKKQLLMFSKPLSDQMTTVEDNTYNGMENELCVRVKGNLNISIYDESELKVADIVDGECSESFDKTIFTYNPVNDDTADLYIPNSGYKLVFSKSDSNDNNSNNNDTLSITVQTLNNEGTTTEQIHASTRCCLSIPAVL